MLRIYAKIIKLALGTSWAIKRVVKTPSFHRGEGWVPGWGTRTPRVMVHTRKQTGLIPNIRTTGTVYITTLLRPTASIIVNQYHHPQNIYEFSASPLGHDSDLSHLYLSYSRGHEAFVHSTNIHP